MRQSEAIRISSLCESNLKVPLRRLPFDSLRSCGAVGGWAQTTQTETLTGSVKAFFTPPLLVFVPAETAGMKPRCKMAVSSPMQRICSEREQAQQRWPQSSEKSPLSVQKEVACCWKKCDQKRERGAQERKGKERVIKRTPSHLQQMAAKYLANLPSLH